MLVFSMVCAFEGGEGKKSFAEWEKVRTFAPAFVRIESTVFAQVVELVDTLL